MNDKELLELAAKAAGIELTWSNPYVKVGDFARVPDWNPLKDDGDALRLAVKLGFVIDTSGDKTFCGTVHYDAIEHHKDDPYAATRRAIVRAAAEIGRGME